MKYTLSLGLALLLTAFSAHPARAQSTLTALTNADVIRFVATGLSDQVVNTVINEAKGANATRFDISPSAVADLAAHGVSTAVIAAMRQPTAPTPLVAGIGTRGPSTPAATGVQTPAPIPLLPLVNQIIGSSLLHKTMYTLTFQYSKEPAKKIDQVRADIRDIALGRVYVKPDENVLYAYGRQAAFAFIATYSDVITKTLEGLILPNFLYGNDEAPIVVGSHRGQVAVVLTGVVHDSVFNVNRTTARSRAVDVVRALVFPAFSQFGPLSQLPNVGFVGIEGVYGSKEFAVNPVLSGLTGEVVTVVIPSTACQKFIAGEMSEDELLRISDVYLQDRDTPLEARKVTLALQ